ncbi:MAG TPA: molybdopterin-synthase adenylyltransferase MoeB [Gammaproteobacteria bacterium]|nr:molybdopterin-synthase adenylyltransferase MoeB [Gammaproteobacteria bacterium]
MQTGHASTPTSDSDALRYSRHLALPDFGAAGQARLAAARVLIVGLGGLGSPAALYLAAAGTGTLLLNDFERVDLSNLQRQLLHANADVGRNKTDSARDTLTALNPECRIECLDRRLGTAELEAVVAGVNVVLDGSDNFGTRFAVNAACVRAGTPLVSGAAIRYSGQLAAFMPRDAASPCYACLYPEGNEELENCQSNGVLAPLTGVIGSMMAVEAIKLITGVGNTLCGRLLQYDARDATLRVTRLQRDPDCVVCRNR